MGGSSVLGSLQVLTGNVSPSAIAGKTEHLVNCCYGFMARH